MGLPTRSRCLFVVPLLLLTGARLGSGLGLMPARPTARPLQSSATEDDVPHKRSLPPAHALIQLAIDTGGEAIAVRRVPDLANVYEQIASTLRQRYRLGYLSSPAAEDGRRHRISVRIPDMNVIARTRTGYYAPTARAPAGTPSVR